MTGLRIPSSGILRRWLPLVYLLPIAYLLKPVFWNPIDCRFYNFFQSERDIEPWTEVVVIGIDERTREEVLSEPVYPLSRHLSRHADLTRRLHEAGARAIVFDLRLSEDVIDSPVANLSEAFRSAGDVYLVMSVTEKAGAISGTHGAKLQQALVPHPDLLAASRGAFLAEFWLDADGVVRRFRAGAGLERLHLETLPERLSGTSVSGSVPIEFPSVDQPMPIVSYRDVLDGDKDAMALVAGRIAFVGSLLSDSGDIIVAPRPQLLHEGGWKMRNRRLSGLVLFILATRCGGQTGVRGPV